MCKALKSCVILAAFAALAITPSAASATNDPDLTHPSGTLLAVGATLTATNVGNIVMTDASTNPLVTCSKAEMTGTLTKNNGSEVEDTITSLVISGDGPGGECTSSFGGITFETNVGNGIPWCTRSTPTMNTDEFQIRGGTCSEAARSITLVLNSTTIGKCKYARSSVIVGTYTTHPEDAVKHISHVEISKEEGGFLCPSKGFFDMTFTLETDTSTPDPVYIS